MGVLFKLWSELLSRAEYKKVRADIKKRTAEAQRWQKKAKKIRSGMGGSHGAGMNSMGPANDRQLNAANQELLRAADAAQIDLNSRLALLQVQNLFDFQPIGFHPVNPMSIQFGNARQEEETFYPPVYWLSVFLSSSSFLARLLLPALPFFPRIEFWFFFFFKETEKQALKSALVEERSRYCLFVACLKPVMASTL